jgi:hypothetical protein
MSMCVCIAVAAPLALQHTQQLPCTAAPQVPTWKLQAVYSLKHLPADVRPARPARWLALALDTGVTIRDSMPAVGKRWRRGGGWGAGSSAGRGEGSVWVGRML